MKVYCCQYDIAWEDKRANFARVRNLLAEAEVERNSLIVLPEMFSTGFSMNVESIAEEADGEASQFLSFLAVEFGCYVVGGIATRSAADKGRNEAVAVSPAGSEIGRYSKMHPFRFGGESEHYAAGDDVAVFPCRGFALAPFICYDLRFPEIFRLAARRNAEVFVVIASWPEVRHSHWLPLLRARAIENQAYVIAVNRTGSDPHHAYAGGSVIIGPEGELVADGGLREGVLSAELDRVAVETYRREFPALGDMRPDQFKL